MIYKDKKNGKLFLLNDSDNYGFDCYSFTKDREPEDGYIPFAYDCLPTEEPARSNELELIRKWDKEMTEEERIDFCLKGMGSSLDKCKLIEDEDLEEELFDMC